MTQFATYTALITACVQRLRQVQGTQTQLYAEPVIGSLIQEGYEILRKEAWWPWLMKRMQASLDGVTGTIIGNAWVIGGLNDFDDIRAVWLSSYQQRLPVVDESINPEQMLGTQFARFIEPLSYHADPTGQYLFRVLPMTTTGTVYVWARCDPANLFTTPSVVVPMNKYLLHNYVMFRYWTDDGSNPAAAAAALQAYEKIKTQELMKVNSTPIWLDPGYGQTNDAWQER